MSFIGSVEMMEGITREYRRSPDNGDDFRAYARIRTTDGRELWRSRSPFGGPEINCPVEDFETMEEFIAAVEKVYPLPTNGGITNHRYSPITGGAVIL